MSIANSTFTSPRPPSRDILAIDTIGKKVGLVALTSLAVAVGVLTMGIFPTIACIALLAIGYGINRWAHHTLEEMSRPVPKYDVEAVGAPYVDFNQLKKRTTFGYLKGLVKDVCFAVTRLFTRCGRGENYSVKISEKSSEGLICMFHGLKAHPSQHDRIRDALFKDHGDSVTYYQPFVEKAGNGKRSEIVRSHLEEVVKWTENNPGKPVCLIGISNGVLLSSEIAIALNDLGIQAKVFGIAGPIFGTTMMNKPEASIAAQEEWNSLLQSKLPMVGGHSAEVINEMSWGGDPAKDLITRIRDAAYWETSFEFFATSDDSKVTPPASGLPSLVVGAKYHTFTGEGHSSIADAAIPAIRSSMANFRASNQDVA